MGKSIYEQLANEVVELLGGKSNVEFFSHCVTRLRFNLKDQSLVKKEEIEKLPGVLGSQWAANQYQIIIGQGVNEAYDLICKVGGFEKQGSVDEVIDGDLNEKKSGNIVNRILDTLAGIFTPVIPSMIGCAMIKAVLIILKTFNLIDLDGQLYAILTFVGDAAYYFLPMLLAWSAAKKFKTNVGFALTLAGILLHPSFGALMSAGEPVKLLGLPVTNATYSSSVIPIILTVWVLSYIERFVDKIVPNIVKAILKPLLVILIMFPLTLIVLGPLGAIIGNGLAAVVTFINTHAGWLVSALIGGIFPFLIMTGMHYSLGPVVMTVYAATGVDSIVGPGMLVHSFTQSAAALAVALKTKNATTKQVGLSTSLTAALGVTEPAMFGVNLKFKRPLAAVVIGGVAGGFYAGLMGVGRSALGITGLLTFPAFITENPMSMVHAIIASAIGFAVTFILTLVLGFEDTEE